MKKATVKHVFHTSVKTVEVDCRRERHVVCMTGVNICVYIVAQGDDRLKEFTTSKKDVHRYFKVTVEEEFYDEGG